MDIAVLTLPQLLMLAGIVALIAELILGLDTGFDLVLIGTILIMSGLTGNLFDSTTVSLTLATILGAGYILFGRSWVKSRIKSTNHQTNIDKLIGQTGYVTQEVTPKKAGFVKIDDEIWRANASKKIEPNQRVKVKRLEGVTVFVTEV